jgi:cell surface protein
MRNFTFKGLLLTAVFMLLGSTAILAADDGLITRQIKLDEAGTLPDRIGENQKYLITNLKIVGKINGTDLKFIREMAGCDFNGKETDGKLSILDLSEAKIVEGGSAYYSDRDDGFIYTSNDKLGDYVFNDCYGLTSLTLPSSVTKIGCYALSNCIGLTSLTLPSSVTEIGEGAFLNCRGLTNFTIPSGVTSIGHGAFFCCYGLISLTIPSSVTSIGSRAVNYCSGLTSIYAYMEKLPETGSNLFLGCDEKKCTVYVPKGTYDDYFVSEFGFFSHIVEFDATGIDKTTTSTDVEEVSRYSLNGQRLVGPTKGLNIVKYSDGSVKKVAVE